MSQKVALLLGLALLSQAAAAPAQTPRKGPERDRAGVPLISTQPPEVLRATALSVEHLRAELDKKNRTGKATQSQLQRQVLLTFQQATVLVALGQATLSAKPEKIQPLDRKALSLAAELLRDLRANRFASKTITPLQWGKLHRIAGMAFFYSNAYAAALEEFEKSLKFDMNSPDATWTAFMAAEEQFEQSNFKRAAELYSHVKKQGAAKSKITELSSYKLAWAFMNLERSEQAQRDLIELIRSGADEALAQDAAKDLAFILARTSSEKEVVSLYDQNLSQSGPRGASFLRRAVAALEQQGRLSPNSALRAKAIAAEKDPSAKVAILADSIQGVAKEYASQAHADRVMEVLGKARDLPLGKNAVLEAASEYVIKNFSEAYAGKAKTPEKIEKPALATQLRLLIKTHLTVFLESKRKSQLYGVWMDVCELERDAECLVGVSAKALEDQSLTIRSRAMDARLLGLELLVAKPEGKRYRSEFMDVLSERLADSKAKNAAQAGAKLAQLQVEDRDYSAAVKTLSSVLALEPSHQHWYSLKWAQLQMGDFHAVMEEPKARGISSLSGEPNPKLRALQAEATLKLATKARSSGDVSAMGAQIQRFESLSEDPKQANLARDEWIHLLIEKKDYAQALARIAGFPSQWHQRAEASQFKGTLLDAFVDAGDYGQVTDWFHTWDGSKAKGPGSTSSVLATLITRGPSALPYDRVEALDPTQRTIWLLSATLSQPEWAYQYFRRYEPKDSSEESLDVLAHRLLGKTSTRDPALRVIKKPKVTGFEKSASQVSFPSPAPKKAGAQQKYTRQVQESLENVKKHRELLVASLKGQVAEAQLAMIQAQRMLESRASALILGSPIPAGLPSAQLAEYRRGLAQLAEEYQQQVKELDGARAKIKSKIEEEEKKASDAEKARTLPLIPAPNFLMAGVDVADKSPLATVVRLAHAKNPWGALMELERVRSKKRLRDNDYWRTRTWVLYSREGSPDARRQALELRRYLYDELSGARALGIFGEAGQQTKTEATNK